MTTLQERIANERRRLRSVRQNMLAGIEHKSNGNENYVPFYIAAADYIETTMQRVHEQDIKMDQMIREKVEAMDESIEQALAELHQRLDRAKEHLKPFLAARDALREQGAEALEKFEEEGKKYSDFIVSTMGHHGATSDLAADLFSAEDWEYMAGISDEETERDTAMFDQFQQALPPDLTHLSA